MTTQESKKHILAWLPVMIEMEAMGVDPVKSIFGGGEPNTETAYRALTLAKTKYPEWYRVMSRHI